MFLSTQNIRTHPKNIQITAAGTKQTGKDLPVMAARRMRQKNITKKW